ncbi:diphthine--ammonia ligase [Runella aurantiaca]|uniref:Diphthine--ammonia ligase n=2 Tax=Runella aurantiaca TaxID=2282308 RepID=A0A369IFH7_9BACT|nr:diphthine--ammonia ligase [Runella aurantiaca]
MNWSGGKDSALALYHSLQNNACDVRYLLTSLNDSFRRISMHGVREELLDQQAQRLGIELLKLRLPETTSMEEYQIRTAEILQPLAAAGITKSIFGDIFLEDLRLYRENQLETVGMQGIFPLWKRPSMELLEEFWGLGFKTIVVSINGNVLDQSFCGRVLDRDFVSELPPNIDPCGENGEFHTFVFEAPYFSQPIDFQQGETVEMTYHFQNTEGEDLTSTYFFTDLLPI